MSICSGKKICEIWKIYMVHYDQVDFNSEIIVFLIQCDKENCKLKKYVWESEKTTKERISEYRGSIFRKETRHATGHHFNQPGHSLTNIKLTVIEIVKKTDSLYRKEHETYHIRMNRSPGGS